MSADNQSIIKAIITKLPDGGIFKCNDGGGFECCGRSTSQHQTVQSHNGQTRRLQEVSCRVQYGYTCITYIYINVLRYC